MNVLKPEIIWIEGRCYRMNNPISNSSSFQEHDLYENETYSNGDDYNDEDEFEVQMIDNNRFSTSFHVSKHYIGRIIGKKGATKQRIERDTRTEIKIPRQEQNGDITIFGSSASNVQTARRRLNDIIISSRLKETPTHFLSIPTNNQTVTKSFIDFKDKVLRECSSDKGVESSIFIRPEKLHLTLCVMSLMDNDERLQASNLLEDANEKIVLPILREHSPLRIRLQGLSYMNDDPSEINVLYGCVKEEGNSKGVLQQIADELVDQYYRAGLGRKEHEHVKLHVTLLNSKYRSQPSDGNQEEVNSQSGKFRNSRIAFDGTNILKKFADYDFGVIELTEIHLSQRHTAGSGGFYEPTFVVSCNI